MEDTLSGSYEPGQYAKYGEEPASNSAARGNQSEYDEFSWTRVQRRVRRVVLLQ